MFIKMTITKMTHLVCESGNNTQLNDTRLNDAQLNDTEQNDAQQNDAQLNDAHRMTLIE